MNQSVCRMLISTFEARIDDSQSRCEIINVLEEVDNSSLLTIDIDLLYDYAYTRAARIRV